MSLLKLTCICRCCQGSIYMSMKTLSLQFVLMWKQLEWQKTVQYSALRYECCFSDVTGILFRRTCSLKLIKFRIGEGILYKVMHRVAPPPSLTPYPLYISLTEKVAFSHTCLGSLHPFCKPLDLRWEQYYGEISSITRGHVSQKRTIIYSVYVHIVH